MLEKTFIAFKVERDFFDNTKVLSLTPTGIEEESRTVCEQEVHAYGTHGVEYVVLEVIQTMYGEY